MNIISLIVTCVLSVLYVWTLYNIPILVVGIKSLREKSGKRNEVPRLSDEDLPTFSITVPVKNEEKVIGRLLDSLLKLDYPPKKREIIIVEDGSTDKTKEICMEYAGRYPNDVKFLHRSMSNGKPSALNYALKHSKGEIVAIFDADSVPERDVLLRAAQYFEDSSVAAVQGRTCSINADENMLTKFLSYEEAVRYEAHIRGKDALGLYIPLLGSCQFIRKEALEEVCGWNEDSLSEDLETSLVLIEKGYRIKYASDVRSWQENPANLARLMGQRTRWFRGCMEVALRYGRLLKNPNKVSVDAEITLAGPYMFAPCLLGYVMAVYSFLVPFQPGPNSVIIAQVVALLTTVLLLMVGIALVYVTKPRKWRNLLWLPFIYLYWSVQNFIALWALIQIVFRRPRRWRKTMKTGIVTNHLLSKLETQEPWA